MHRSVHLDAATVLAIASADFRRMRIDHDAFRARLDVAGPTPAACSTNRR
jgi:hypothetical protein